MTFIWVRSPEGKLSAEKEVIIAYLVLTSICSSTKGEETTMETRKEDKENKTKQEERWLGIDVNSFKNEDITSNISVLRGHVI